MATLNARRNRVDLSELVNVPEQGVGAGVNPDLDPILRDAIGSAAPAPAISPFNASEWVERVPTPGGQPVGKIPEPTEEQRREAFEAMRDSAISGMMGTPGRSQRNFIRDSGSAIVSGAVRGAEVIGDVLSSGFTPTITDDGTVVTPQVVEPADVSPQGLEEVDVSVAPDVSGGDEIDVSVLGDFAPDDFSYDDPIDVSAPRATGTDGRPLPPGITRGADGQGGEFHFNGIPLSEIRAAEQARNLPPEVDTFGDVTRQPTVGGYRWTQEREAARAAARDAGQLSNADYMSMARARGATGSQVSAEANRLRMEDEGRALDRGLRASNIEANIAAAEARAERQETAAEQAERRLEIQKRRAEESIRSSQARTRQEEERIRQRQTEIDARLNRPGRQSTFEQRRAAIQGMVERGEITAEEGIEAEFRGYMGGNPPAPYLTWREAMADAQTQSSADPDRTAEAQPQQADIFTDPTTGESWRYKGTGNRNDKSNWELI